MENKTNKRQIIIETDGVSVGIVKAEATSLIEFVSILNMAIDFVTKNAQNSAKMEQKEVKPEEKVEETAKIEEKKTE